MSTLCRKLRLSVNTDIIDRSVPDNRLYVNGWNNVEFTSSQLVDHITRGHPYCAQLSGPREEANFLASDIVSLDVDGGLEIADALQHPIIRDNAMVLYTTLRHTPGAHRYRIIFALPRTITNPVEFRAVTRALCLRVAGDNKALDPARLFFGNRNAEFMVFDREISTSLLDELITQGLNPPEPDRVYSGGRGKCAPSRSRLQVAPGQQIRTANDGILPFRELSPRTPVYCPFHNDQHPSAFVVANRHGATGLHCSACGCTYWSKDKSLQDPDPFNDFERAIKGAIKRDETPDWASLGLAQPSSAPGSSTIRIVTGSAMAPELLPGLIMVRSPKGTGKTASLHPLIAESRSVLLIGHRRSLIRQSCNRLDLTCYLDDEGSTKFGRQSRYGICLDSLPRIPPRARFDIIILDESEQVLAHFLSDTMDRGGGSRDRIFVEFGRLLRQAKTVIALDADLGWVTFKTLSRFAASKDPTRSKPMHVWLNEAQPGDNRAIQVFDSEPHLVAELMQTVADGKRCFVTSNAKGKIEKLAAAINNTFPDKKTITITSDTIAGKAVQDFVTDPQSSATRYDVILASPSIGTGINIAFPNNAPLIDAVFGFCEAQITTHLDFDQQLARVRHPGSIKVWITPRRFQFETEFEVVKRDALERNLFRNYLTGYSDEGEPEYNENDPFLDMTALILSEQRASKNDLKTNFIRHKEKQGFIVQEIRKDEMLFGEGKKTIAKRKELDDKTYRNAILSAVSLNRHDFVRVSEVLRRGEWVSDPEKASYEKTNLEMFYRERACEDLVRLDDRRRYRRCVSLFEAVFGSACFTNVILDAERLEVRSRFIVREGEKADLILHFLQLTPLIEDGRIFPNVIIQQSDLVRFADAMTERKTSVGVVLVSKSVPISKLKQSSNWERF